MMSIMKWKHTHLYIYWRAFLFAADAAIRHGGTAELISQGWICLALDWRFRTLLSKMIWCAQVASRWDITAASRWQSSLFITRPHSLSLCISQDAYLSNEGHRYIRGIRDIIRAEFGYLPPHVVTLCFEPVDEPAFRRCWCRFFCSRLVTSIKLSAIPRTKRLPMKCATHSCS